MSNYTEADVKRDGEAVDGYFRRNHQPSGDQYGGVYMVGGVQVDPWEAKARLLAAALEGAKVPGLVSDNAVLYSLVRRAIYGKGDGSCTECGRKGGCAADCEMAREAAKHRPGATLLEELSALQARVAEMERVLEQTQVDAGTFVSERDALRAQVGAVHRLAVTSHEAKVHIAPQTLFNTLAGANEPEPEAPLLCERCADVRGGMHKKCGAPGCECFCGRVRVVSGDEAKRLQAGSTRESEKY